MQTSQSTRKIAIVGMDAYFGSYHSLDAFERSIYEGLPSSDNVELSPTEIVKRFDRVAGNALKDAAVSSDTNIATIVVNDSQQKLDSTVAEVDSVFAALSIAGELLTQGKVEAVSIGGIDFESKALGAVVLKPYVTARDDRIYAVIELGLSTAPEASNTAYLEIIGDRRLEEVVSDLTAEFDSPRHSCAISSVANMGYYGVAGEIASLIKTALCIYYRYIPSVPQWQQPVTQWQTSPFYVASVAKPWFLEADMDKRVAEIFSIPRNARIVLAEEDKPQQRSNTYLKQTPNYFFPLAAESEATLLEQLRTLRSTIENIENGDLATVARQTFVDYQRQKYALAIIGKNEGETLRECDRALVGVSKALATGKDWQTPIGSYFTPLPQGKKGKVAYVYPGAYNAHLGIGRTLFRLFPNLIDDPVIESTCNRIAKLEKLLYPRSINQLSPRESEARERELMNDALAMLESETGFAGFVTTILKDCFQVKPQAAFGYSLGEISMMYAQGIWGDIDRSSDVLNTSPLFENRLAGTKEAVREYWQLADEHQGELWRTYVVMANGDLVREKLQAESHVYLTQISTPKEVIIAGDPQGCERVIASLGCDAFRAPFNHVIHCEAIKSEYDELMKLNTLPLRENSGITFYSAANDRPISLSSPEIAHSLTQTLIQQLDFPRLVDRVYQDNYRIFIEVGAGSNCSRWIKDILKSKEHATISLHRRNTDDFTSLIKALAKLVSHGVELNLSPLYEELPDLDRVKLTPEPADKNSKGADLPQELLALLTTNKFIERENISKDRVEVGFTSKQTKLADDEVKSDEEFKNSSLWRPNFASEGNNYITSKAHSMFIEQEKKHLATSKEIIDTKMKFLQQIIDKS